LPEKKFYVVWKGRNTGVFENWKDCLAQVDGFDGALYRSFSNKEEALKALDSSPWKFIGKANHKKGMTPDQQEAYGNPVIPSISVDAACSGNPGTMEYRGVDTASGKVLFHAGPFPNSTVNIGEFLAIVHGLGYLYKQGSTIPLYSDSKTALTWVRNKKVKTTLQPGKGNEKSFELLERALIWLQNHTYSNPLFKWETEAWGEIPADFGRK